MRLSVLVRESARSAWAMKTASALILLVVAAVCAISVLTVGQAEANDREIREKLNQAGARVLVVSDTSGEGLVNLATLETISSLSTVQTAVALSKPVDVYNGKTPGGNKAPSWYVSDLSLLVDSVRGNLPEPGQGVVSEQSMQTLRFGEPMGYVSADQVTQYPVIGQVHLRQEFEDLAAGVLLQASDQTEYTQLRLLIDDIANVTQTQRAVISILGSADPRDLQVDSPQGLVMASQTLTGQLVSYNQTLLLMIMGAGAFFVMVVALTDVMLHRRDLGRRRALGITRGALTALTTVRSAVPALVGAIVGSGGALIYLRTRDIEVPLDFVGAVIILAVLSATVAALLPAAWAAGRDPVSVLRTP